MTVMTVGELLIEAEVALLEQEKIVERWTKGMVDSNFSLEPSVSEYVLKLRILALAKSQAYLQLALARMQYESSTAV